MTMKRQSGDEKHPNATERKRLREQRRRADLGERFAELAAILREIEPDFRGTGAMEGEQASMDSSSLTRLDIITHTVATLQRIHNENETRKRIIAQLSVSSGTEALRQPVDTTMPGDYGGQMLLQEPGLATYIARLQEREGSVIVQRRLAEDRAIIARQLIMAQQQQQQQQVIDHSAQSHLAGNSSRVVELLALARHHHHHHRNPLFSNSAFTLSQQEHPRTTVSLNPALLQYLEGLRNAQTPRVQALHQQNDESDDDDDNG